MAAQQVSLPYMLDTAAAQLRALGDGISRQRAGWLATYNGTADERELLSSACKVMSDSCDAAANHMTAWAGELRAAGSPLTIPDTLLPLFAPASWARLASPASFAALWSEIDPVIITLRDAFPPSNTLVQSTAVLGINSLLHVGAAFRQLLAANFEISSPPALEMNALLQRGVLADVSPLQQMQNKVHTLNGIVRKFAEENSQYYQGLTGWGALLALLTLLSVLSITTVGGRTAATTGSNQWLAYVVTALGTFHTVLVLIDTGVSPKRLAKTYKVAQKQYERLHRSIDDRLNKLAATPAASALHSPAGALGNAAVPGIQPAPGAAAGTTALLQDAQKAFEDLRTKCPDVYLHADGAYAVEGDEVRKWIYAGKRLVILDEIFKRIEKETPPPRNQNAP